MNLTPSNVHRYLVAIFITLGGCSRSSTALPEPAGSARGAPSVSGAVGAARPNRLARLVEAATTRDILNTLSDDCLACAEKNGCLDPEHQGGVCETMTGKSKNGRSAAAQCVEALRCVFSSKCANTGEQSQCLCGKMDVADCMNGKEEPKGTCVAVYKDDFGNNGKAMYDQFLDRKFGSGQANAIIQCVVPTCPMCRIR